MPMNSRKKTVFDATNCSLGRLASVVAKKLLLGGMVDVVNAEKALVTADSYQMYKDAITRGSREWGPFFPKKADVLVKRTVRGMLPWKTTKGRTAFSNLRTHIGVPAKLAGAAEPLPSAVPKSTIHKRMTVAELSQKLGGASLE